MKKIRFKKHKIERTCKKQYKNYRSYKESLRRDFAGHCAYCDLNEEWVYPLPFETEHFIPRNAFEKAGRTDLETDYRNLMFSCPLCNRLKGDLFSGEIPESEITNPYFYNPVETDYNDIFYRDEKGRIHSDDELGKQMIKTLQFYRPTKQMAWFLDELQEVLGLIQARISVENDQEKAEKLKTARTNIEAALYRKHRVFVHSYRAEKGKRIS